MMKITYRGTKNIMHQATWLNYPRKIPQGHQRRRTEAPVRVVFRAWCTFLENERQRQYIDRRVKLTVSNDPGRPCSTYCTITKLYYKKKRLEPFWNISTPFPSFFVDCLRWRLVSPTTHALFKEITPLMCCDLPGKVCADACDACKAGVACDCAGAVTG